MKNETKTTCPQNQKANLLDFIETFKNQYVYIRDVRLADELRVRQFRTKKNTHLAAVWDELGNVFILTAEGVRRQIIRDEKEYKETMPS